uniref:Uncharacterized protein n=1 Tax=Avena sativa TaxID=4498 RepID=A0ACD5WCM3_AVESA
MFRFINAWLQAMFRYITAWLQSAAADEPDAASLQGTAAMDFPVTVSLGPLHRQLHSSFKAGKNKLPDGVSEGEIQRLQEDLEILFTELKIVLEADDPSFTAKCWMKEVRELRYDTEDFLDEVLRPRAGDGDGTRRNALLTIILWIPSKLKRRRQVAKAFSDLWARVKDASKRRQRFQLGPATIKPEFIQGNVSRCFKHIPSSQLLEESMDKLVKLLALPNDEEIVEPVAFDTQDAEEQVQVVPIFGFAGVGKTTLARAFYRNFGGKFQCQAFVRVSRNPDMRMLLSSMLSQIKAPPVHGSSDVQDLIEDIREYLRCKRYLVVIDDLWASSTWDIIRRAFPDGDCCSRIIVTTEIKDVALACCRYQFKYMYEMGPLNGDQSKKLFLSRAFGSENNCAPDFKEVMYEIIRKCGGLALATENIASMLACELNIKQWKHVRDSLPSILSLRTNPSSEGLKEVLNIIYTNLSPKLKTCLLYLIMYPEGYTINKDELVKQWVAEDFISEEQDRVKTAGDYFDELVSMGMIQPVDRNYNDEVLTCTVHHMVLDLIRYKSLEENFIISVSCFQTTPGLPDKVRRLSLQFGGAKCANIPAEFMITQVRSLIFFGFLNCVPSIVEYKLLRVLILHIWADESKTFDLTRISELFQLRYLKIHCNITVHLPDEIRQLKGLETLEIHAPVTDMPLDISCLPLLHTLGYFDLSKNSIENVQNLGELNNLQELHLTWSNTAEPDNLKNNMQCLGSILWKLSNLKSLTLVPAVSYHAYDLDDAGAASMGISGDVLGSVSSPPALLERLELSRRCVFSSLPEWTKELDKLCILKIAVRKLLRKDIDILKGLPAFRALSLYVWTAPVGKVVFDNEGFSVLKYFKFICAAPCVVFLKGSMPSVRELKLAFSANGMEQYSQVVAGLVYLTELEEITAKVWGTGADESYKRYTESALSEAIANHLCTPIIRVRYIDRILYGEEDTSAITQEEHWTLEKQHEIQEELLDRLPELLISSPSTQTQMRDGGQNEETDRSIEVLTQEQEHWTLKKRGIQEELVDPVPECLSTPSTPTQTRDGVQTEQIEGSKDVLTHELEHWTLEKKHEIQEEFLDHLPEVLSTPRSREVLTQEQEHWTLVKQHKIQEELLDPLPTQTQTRDGVQGELIEGCSPEIFVDDQELSPLSSALRSPAYRSAPPAPMHPNLFPKNHISHPVGNWSDSINPLPLRPFSVFQKQTNFIHWSVPEVETSSVAGQWQRRKVIGSGTYGCVYEATNRRTGALCAMKEVSIFPDDAKSMESLMQLGEEIKLLSKFKHENIVQYYGSETTEDGFYIYLEYVHPGSVNKYISQYCGAITESVVRNFTRHILKGLAFLHSQNIIHRDIKGTNLLVDVNGIVKLADFGIAMHLSTAAPNLSLKGSPYWMAPEVVRATLVKDVSYGLAVDIWSVGCTIIEVFTGKPPWSGLEGPAAMFKVLNKDPPIPDNLSSDGKDFLRVCFKRNPAERPTASKLLEHPFIQSSSHFSQNASTLSLAGTKYPDVGHSPREKKSRETLTYPREKQTNTLGETTSSHLPVKQAVDYLHNDQQPGSLGHRLMTSTSLETHGE